MPSSGKIKTKNRNKLPHYVHVSGTGCTHLLALYWLMVFINETHVIPSSGKIKTKRHLFSYLVISGSVLPNVSVAPNRNKLPHYVHVSGTGCTHLLALYWLMVFIHETHVMPCSGKVITKRHLFSYLVISGSVLPVAPIFWHYIDWWCLFMKHMWCHLVAKYKLKGSALILRSYR